jgi:hypothetical protein
VKQHADHDDQKIVGIEIEPGQRSFGKKNLR